jgi:N6-L-threonylcarbamoyladenine synthase
MDPKTILAIETSCDETAAAVISGGRKILSNTVYSQIPLHQIYGGVVPELASRNHLEKISEVVEMAMAESGLQFKDLDAIAVTKGPGLVGALLVGVSYAKALAYALEKPLDRRTPYPWAHLCELFRVPRLRAPIFDPHRFWGAYHAGAL